MRSILVKIHKAVIAYAVWGWPIVAIDGALQVLYGVPATLWRDVLNDGGFAWVLCAAVGLLTLILDQDRRERAMSKLFGLREGDERERAVTGDAARTTLLLSLSLQVVLLVLSLTTVQLVWNPKVPKGEQRGLLSVGLKFSTTQHLKAFGFAEDASTASTETPPGRVFLDGYVLSPAAFPILLALILLQIAAFKAFSRKRYEGMDA
jgi:hypothetical protein